jgi:putative lipoprotein
VPYNAVQAGQVISATGLTGIYKGFLPAATCCGQDITLALNFDHSAALQTDYLNGEAPLVETGVWTTTPNSQVEVTLTNTASPLTLEVKEGLLVTSPDEAAYGQAGLSLYRFEVIAQNSLQLTVTGAVTYLQRTALPPDAVVTVKLAQVAPGGAAAAPIGEQVITSPGQVPIPFTLTYKLGDIDWTQTYAIQAQITAGGQLLFTTTHTYTVITQGNPDTVEVGLEPVSTSSSAEP